MDKVPVKLVESWGDIVSRKENKEAKGNDGTTNNNNVLDEKSRGSSRMPRSGNELLGDGRTTTKDVELFDGKSDSIEQRSGIQDARDNRETMKNSEQGSFLLPKRLFVLSRQKLGKWQRYKCWQNIIISYQNAVRNYN